MNAVFVEVDAELVLISCVLIFLHGIHVFLVFMPLLFFIQSHHPSRFKSRGHYQCYCKQKDLKEMNWDLFNVLACWTCLLLVASLFFYARASRYRTLQKKDPSIPELEPQPALFCPFSLFFFEFLPFLIIFFTWYFHFFYKINRFLACFLFSFSWILNSFLFRMLSSAWASYGPGLLLGSRLSVCQLAHCTTQNCVVPHPLPTVQFGDLS